MEGYFEKKQENKATVYDLSLLLQEKLGSLYPLIEISLNKASNVVSEGSTFSRTIDPEKQNVSYRDTALSDEVVEIINNTIKTRMESFNKEAEFYKGKGNDEKTEEMKQNASLWNFKIIFAGDQYFLENQN